MKRILIISGVVTGLLLSLTLAGWADADDRVNKALDQGNAQYVSQKYDGALSTYEEGLKAKPESKTLNFNAAQAAYVLGDYEKAAQYYEKALECKDKYLNAGNIFFRMGDAGQDVNQKAQCYTQALQIYKEGIMKYPQDVQLKFNYELVKEKLDALMKEMEQENDGQNNEWGEGQNSQQNNNPSEKGEQQEGQEQNSKGENSQQQQDTSQQQDNQNGENQGEGQEGNSGQPGAQPQEDEVNPDQEAIARILEKLDSQEEESLKNNQGVVSGKDEAYGW